MAKRLVDAFGLHDESDSEPPVAYQTSLILLTAAIVWRRSRRDEGVLASAGGQAADLRECAGMSLERLPAASRALTMTDAMRTASLVGPVGNPPSPVGHERAMEIDDSALWSRAFG